MNITAEDISVFFPAGIRKLIKMTNIDYSTLQEIHIRCRRYISFSFYRKEMFLLETGALSYSTCGAHIVTETEIKELLDNLSGYSLYAYEDEVRQGYITIAGGHRVGIAGRAVIENGRIKTVRNISSLNIRISHEINGCADMLIPYVLSEAGLNTTMLISPPCCGKTTLLRDIIRQLSDLGYRISLIDERSEIAGCHKGIPQNDIGIHTDVLDCCPKAEGMLQMIRAMSPKLIAVDEIGLEGDIAAIKYAMICGCKVLCTVHGYDYEELTRKPYLNELLKMKIIERYIILSNRNGIGTIEHILNADGCPIR